eukprot:UN04521
MLLMVFLRLVKHIYIFNNIVMLFLKLQIILKTNLTTNNIIINLPTIFLTQKQDDLYGCLGAAKPTVKPNADGSAKPNVPPKKIENQVSIDDLLIATIINTTVPNHVFDKYFKPNGTVDGDFDESTTPIPTSAKNNNHFVGLTIVVPTQQKYPANLALSNYIAARDGINLAESIIFSKELGAEPANTCDCNYMEYVCELFGTTHQTEAPNTILANTVLDNEKKIEVQNCGDYKFNYKVYDNDKLTELGHDLLVSVGKGSRADNKPRIAVFEYYNPDPELKKLDETQKTNEVLGMCGKSVVFDTGGLSIKGRAGMLGMHFDKLGAVNEFAIIRTLVLNQIQFSFGSGLFVGAFAIVDNSVSSTAIQPGDVFMETNKVNIVVTIPDAEGRNALASALQLVQNIYRVSTVITMATLTGNVGQALNSFAAGIFTNAPNEAKKLISQGQTHGERYWHLPIFDKNEELLNSPYADCMNTLNGANSGASQAAAFLTKFLKTGASQ